MNAKNNLGFQGRDELKKFIVFLNKFRIVGFKKN